MLAAALRLDPTQMIDLSASMNPFAPDVSALLIDRLRDIRVVGRYPDAAHITSRLANAIGIDPELLVMTNGGSEAIALVAHEVPAAHVVEPEFSLYKRHLQRVESASPRWRSNPSNPLGTLAEPHENAGVWDEAFYPLATGTWTRGDSTSWRLGSLTKLWACPGLRLGFVIAPSAEAARRIRERQPRWAVNGLALAVVDDLLNVTDLIGWKQQIDSLRAMLVSELLSLSYRVEDTAVNWVLVQCDLREQLAPHGIVVRDCASFGMNGWSRVALPRPVEMERVLTAFAAVNR